MPMLKEANESAAATEAATEFIRARYPDCVAAFLAGRRIVVIAPALNGCEAEVIQSSHIEALVYTPASYQQRVSSDAQRREPLLSLICAEGVALVNQAGLADRIGHEARVLLAKGPEPRSEMELSAQRHQVTRLLDEFIAADSREENLFIAAELIAAVIKLILSHNRQWTGHGRWAWHWLQRYNPALAETLLLALKAFYRTGGKSGLVTFVESLLENAGGRLSENDRAERHAAVFCAE